VPELAAQFGEADDLVEVGLDVAGAADPVAAATDLRGTLAGIDGVHRVQIPDRAADPVVVRAERGTGPRVRAAILALAASGSLPLTSVREVVPSLDDVYRRALEERGLAAHGRVAA
jgi:hypothetical protein